MPKFCRFASNEWIYLNMSSNKYIGYNISVNHLDYTFSKTHQPLLSSASSWFYHWHRLRRCRMDQFQFVITLELNSYYSKINNEIHLLKMTIAISIQHANECFSDFHLKIGNKKPFQIFVYSIFNYTKARTIQRSCSLFVSQWDVNFIGEMISCFNRCSE